MARRQARTPDRERVLRPLRRLCPACGSAMRIRYVQRDNQDERRIASPEMFPSIELLPHLKCSRPGWDRRGSDEAGEHGDA